ncbi:UDP-N-acetylmuramyl-tripeptide synthetase [Thioalkalivibrio sulfidiphilus HL-EbGr7]|uniref:UDP-N-acetylmuramoyl-L-alanyl-D-glutamate--2,6-diaminopimelate ligase n=1 Tax=Thioalkalivibrio sulfidiphilus (strain HL-EbGR7) TaxID=396588 RepID=B8GMM4_THISH|nr:UDP-N-acetylmuramoyl-L-alanyl-D-glutamate--2,6-diaminopimelate ligase [Thioalkalivibrio sulfidiphilus]ACL71856.1 UDP-N-acetylmuramyl-tripeptide synthetase [Thioalkalivibrio sulfidiphilus HL-EbGr7]
MMSVRANQPDWRLSTLLEGFAAVSPGLDVPLRDLCLDSRRAQPGAVFIALAGHRAHGLSHAAEALARGAVAVLWEPAPGVEAPVDLGVPCVAVPGLGQRLGEIADRFFGHPSGAMKLIGVTGTDGKTSVSQFLAQTLYQESGRCGVIGTLGAGVYGELVETGHTTPDALSLHRWLADLRGRGVRYTVMEVSSHALVQGRINGAALDIAVLTNLSRDHLDYHDSMEAYAEAKARLFRWPGLETAILNLDDAFGRKLAAELAEREVQILGYGLAAASGEIEQVRGESVEYRPDGLAFSVVTPWGSGRLETGLLGAFNVHNLLAVLAALLQLGLSLTDALERLTHVRTVPGRMERFSGGKGATLVVDYAHTPAALAQVLQALRMHCEGRLWCVFGCGGNRDPGKRPLMARASEQFADRVVLTSDNPRHEDPQDIAREVMTGFERPAEVHQELDRQAAVEWAWSHAAAGDLVLVAGKGHETVQIVGDEQRPFSDRDLARRLVSGMAEGNGEDIA